MSNSEENQFLEAFRSNRKLYDDYSKRVEAVLADLARTHGIRVHSINSRVKEEASLLKKYNSSVEKYKQLNDMTDIAGVRIISFFSDDVDKLADKIESEFVVDLENSIDKRALLDPDRFGYLSLHYVVSLSEVRTNLPEYKRFKGLKIEVQIRSIMQHAWAEIEHDSGYKSKQAVPKNIRRDFSRLAGLIELADQEFINIRNNLEEYESKVAEQIELTPNQVSLDLSSIKSFVKDDQLVAVLEKAMVEFQRSMFREDDTYLNMILIGLSAIGVSSIGELKEHLSENKDKIIPLYQAYFNFNGSGLPVTKGSSLMTVVFLEAKKKNDENFFRELYTKMELSDIEEVKRAYALVYPASIVG